MAISTAAAIIGGSLIGAGASIKAASAQKKAAKKARAAQATQYAEQQKLQEPFRQAGLSAKDELLTLLGIGGDKTAARYGSAAKPFGMAQFQADPGYAFRRIEGIKALERSAAARGGLLSGSMLKGIERFGQDLASQEYGNAFNRYQIERAARLNPLQSMMGAGQSAVNIMTNAAGQFGQQSAQNAYNAGQARASGYIGIGNALTGAISQGLNYNAQQPLLNAMTNYYNTAAGSGGGSFGGGIGGSTVYNPFAVSGFNTSGYGY